MIGNGEGARERLIIGRIDNDTNPDYGMIVKDNVGNVILRCDHDDLLLAGWKVNASYLESNAEDGSSHVRINANGNIGCYGDETFSQFETAYQTVLLIDILVMNLNDNKTYLIPANNIIYIFSGVIGKLNSQFKINDTIENTQAEYSTPPADLMPQPSSIINFVFNNEPYQLISFPDYDEVSLSDFFWNITTTTESREEVIETDLEDTSSNIITTYTYTFTFTGTIPVENSTVQVFSDINYQNISIDATSFIPDKNNAWLIKNNGDAIFHNIYTDGGTIGGWWVDNNSIYQTNDGTKERNTYNSDGTLLVKDGNIRTQFNSIGIKPNQDFYSIITDSMKATEANIGGLLFSNGLINGFDLNSVITRLNVLVDGIYPVGSYYWSSNSTSPAALFGGTWEQIKDKFVLAAGDDYTVDATGGEAEHTLTAGELPKLSGSTPNIFTGGQSGGTSGIVTHTVSSNRQYTTNGTSTNSWQSYEIAFGGDQAHNNMPPYIVAYCWHRIA